MAQGIHRREHMRQGGRRLPAEFVQSKKLILCTAKSRGMINMMQKQHSTNAKWSTAHANEKAHADSCPEKAVPHQEGKKPHADTSVTPLLDVIGLHFIPFSVYLYLCQ